MDGSQTMVRCFVASLVLVFALHGCDSPSRPGLPPGSPFARGEKVDQPLFGQGVAAGDVGSHSAQIWFRTDRPSRVRVEWAPAVRWQQGISAGEEAGGSVRAQSLRTSPERDLTSSIQLQGLEPATSYRYRVGIEDPNGQGSTSTSRNGALEGRFTTAPPPDQHSQVSFVWSSDLGGQGYCRDSGDGYTILGHMRDVSPDFGILLGDLIYADDTCPSPPNAPGSEFKARSLEEFRAKHRYQREDPAMRAFLAEVPVYVTWDDHEVRNNFSGPHHDLMPVGRRALLEYWPISTPRTDPYRLYRQIRYGANLELFILDTRQYRSPNREPDGPTKTMLGDTQRDWLLQALAASNATWKVIATSVPISTRKSGSLLMPGNDSWTSGKDGTGFRTELQQVVRTIMERRIRNVLWLAGDVHFTQINGYDPDKDGTLDFYEFISGPLSAATRDPTPPESDFNPTSFYGGGGFSNFGLVSLDRDVLTVTIIDAKGTSRFKKRLRAR